MDPGALLQTYFVTYRYLSFVAFAVIAFLTSVDCVYEPDRSRFATFSDRWWFCNFPF